MPQDTRLATSGGLIGLPRAQNSVENGPCFGCMCWDNKSFRLRVYFYTQMPPTLDTTASGHGPARAGLPAARTKMLRPSRGGDAYALWASPPMRTAPGYGMFLGEWPTSYP